jgi:hypothetical protein
MNLIINSQYFEDNTVIDTDFSVEKSYIHLIEAHEIQVFELLGKELFDRVQTILSGTPAGLELDLINLLKPFTVKATEINLIPFLNSPVTAKGTQDRTGNFTQSANDTNTGLTLDAVRSRLETYAQKVRNFLDDNRTEFPEWKHCHEGGQNFYSCIHGV